MPVIQTIDAKQGLDIGSAPSPQFDTSAARAAGQQAGALANVGQEVSNVAQQFMRREEQTQDFSARLGLQQAVQGISTEDQDALQSIPANGDGWHENRVKAAKAKLDGFVGTLPPRLQQEFRQRADVALGGLDENYAGQQLKQRSAWAFDNVKNTTQGAENAVFTNPEALEQQRTGLHDLIKSAPIGEIEKQKMTRATDEALEVARIRGLTQRDPAAAKKALGAASADASKAIADTKAGAGETVGGIPVKEPLPDTEDAPATRTNGPPGSGGRARAMAAFDRGSSIKSYYEKNYGLSDVAAAAIGGHAIRENGGRSSGKPGDNGASFGTFQWNGARLDNLKKFASGKNADWTDQKTQLDFAAWEGEHGDAGAQRAWRELKSATTPEDAVKAWMHFERPQGYSADHPENGHAYRERLSNAKRLLGQSGDVSELDVGGGGSGSSSARNVLGEAPPGAQAIPYEKRINLLNEVESKIREIGVQKRADIDIASDNAATAIQNTGDYTGRMPSRQDFLDAYGATDGPRKADTFETSVGTAREVFAMQGQSQTQIEASLAAARPTSSGENAQLEQARYQTLQSAAERTLKARAADPAAYVMGTMPAVRAAWQGAQPGSQEYTRALRVTAEAQRSIGIAPSDMQLLPDEVAKKVTSTLKDETVASDQKFTSIVSTVFATNDPDQQQAIFRQMVKQGAPAELAGVMAAVQRGDEGAAKRLFEAATVDVSKLPGRTMAGGAPVKPQMIDDQIQTDLMAQGKLGDAIYGLSHGGADSAAIALRDAPLIKKSVELYVRKDGLSVEDAVAKTARDMWGDVKVYRGGWGVNAEAVVPNGVDASALSRGLGRASTETFRPAIEAAARRRLDAFDPKDAGARSVAGQIMARAVDAKMDASTFRTYAPGRIGLVDDATGQFFAGQDGKPLTLSVDDLLKADKRAAVQDRTIEVEGMTVAVP